MEAQLAGPPSRVVLTSRAARRTAATGFAAAAAFGIAFGHVSHPRSALAALGVIVVIGVLAVDPVAWAALAVPAVCLAKPRVGGALAAGDAVLLLGVLSALAAGTAGGLTRSARRLLTVLAVFLALCAVAVAAHPTRQGAQELFHRAVLVGGGIVVGAALVQRGLVRYAFRLLVALAFALALVSMVDGAGGSPAYPLGLHKNFAGAVLAGVLLLVLIVPADVGVTTHRGQLVVLLVVAGGLVATQSRGGILGAALGGVVWYFRTLRRGQGRGGRLLGLVLLAVMAFVAVSSVRQQMDEQRTAKVQNNSLTQRTQVEAETRKLFSTSPVLGVGLRFYNTPEYPTYQPPNNVFDEALAESGVVGTAGLALLVAGSMIIVWRVRDPWGVAGSAMLVNAWFHAQIDIYWANGQSFTWLVVGVALAHARTPLAVRAARGRALAQPQRSEP